MKVLKEAKENLPIDFITSFVSNGWEEVGNLKASIEGIKSTFKGTQQVEKILQDLIDAYLIALGQMELHLDKKDYLDLPDDNKLNEALLESSNESDAEPFEAKKFEDNNKTEIFTELPDYSVEVEQKNGKVEIELEPKNNTTTDNGTTIFTQGDFDEFAERNDKDVEEFEYFTDFGEPDIDENEDSPYKQWLNK